MRRKPVLTIILAVVVVVGFAIYLSYRHSAHHAEPRTLVAASVATQKDVNVEVQAMGTVEAANSVAIRSRVDGQLIQVGLHDGDKVSTGQLLFAIDPRPFDAQLQQAQATLVRDQAQLKNVTDIAVRNGKLVGKGYVGQQDYETLKANVTAAQATVTADMAAVDNAQLQLEYATIRAPLNGRAGEVLLQPGNQVKASDANPLVVINQISPISIKFALPEQNLPLLQHQLTLGPITVLAKTGKEGQTLAVGKLSFVDNTVNSTTGTIALKATFENADQRLWPGQFVLVQLPIQRVNQAVIVPTRAIQNGQSGNYVFVVDKDLRAVLQPVVIGAEVADNTVIEKGVQVGQKVVTAGQLNITNGMLVRLQ